MDILNFFLELLRSDAGSFATVAIILVGIGVLIWKVSHFHTKYSGISEIHDKIGKSNDNVDKKFDRIDEKYDSIKQDIHIIKAFIEILKDARNPLAQSHSPVSLTDKGKEVAGDINAQKLIDENWTNISHAISEKLSEENCNPYDIQVAAFSVGDDYLKFISKEAIEKVKENAYAIGFDLQTYGLLFGVLIRDKFLAERGYVDKDVDSFDPSRKTNDL